MVFSNHPRNDTWSLWNPSLTSNNIVSLPTLTLEDGDYDSVRGCCLSAPPDDPTAVLLLTRRTKPTFVFCKLSPFKRMKNLRKKPRLGMLTWTEMSYTSQLERITYDGDLLHNLTCCNGKIYALCTDSSVSRFVIQVEIVVKDRKVVIRLLPFGLARLPPSLRCSKWVGFLKGSGTELFYITVGFLRETDTTPGDVYLYKLDTTRIKWEELEVLKNWDMTDWVFDQSKPEALDDLCLTEAMWKLIKDLKDAIFFVDLACDNLIYYNPSIASELGGYIQIRGNVDNIIYSYHLSDTTIVPSVKVLPTSHVSMWECRLEDVHLEATCTVDRRQEESEIVAKSVTNDQVGFNESPLLNIPFDVLKMIMEFCVGVEYMNFRATCKICHLAAPVIQWGSKKTLRRLQNYSLVSPWLMVVGKNRGIISFTDPLLGNKYYMKAKLKIEDDTIHCSRFGWLLYKTGNLPVVFYNPFKDDLRELPEPNCYLCGLCFSAPPTSPDCMVVGFTCDAVLIHFVARQEQTWQVYAVGDDPRQYSLSFPTFYDRDIYGLCNERELVAFKNVGKENICRVFFEAEPPTSICRSKAQYFLVKCDQHLLQVVLGGFREPIDAFKHNDATRQWEKISSIGKHAIYICNTTCLCIEAKMPEMENKIYLPQFSSTNKIVFYSLETCTYLSFNGKSIQEKLGDLFTTAHLLQVVLGGFREPIDAFKHNDATRQWEKISSIGKHAIYICNTTCLCIEAKMPEMENKIYLPQFSSTNKIVFYSLETCTYLSFNGKSIQEKLGDLFTTAHLSAQAWIEPSWLVS